MSFAAVDSITDFILWVFNFGLYLFFIVFFFHPTVSYSVLFDSKSDIAPGAYLRSAFLWNNAKGIRKLLMSHFKKENMITNILVRGRSTAWGFQHGVFWFAVACVVVYIINKQ